MTRAQSRGEYQVECDTVKIGEAWSHVFEGNALLLEMNGGHGDGGEWAEDVVEWEGMDFAKKGPFRCTKSEMTLTQ